MDVTPLFERIKEGADERLPVLPMCFHLWAIYRGTAGSEDCWDHLDEKFARSNLPPMGDEIREILNAVSAKMAAEEDPRRYLEDVRVALGQCEQGFVEDAATLAAMLGV